MESLFDGYADGFEEHLVEVLNYRAPTILVDGLRRMQRQFGCALDLGCGTGLCGVLLKPLSKTLHGVDLSRNMVERAAARGVYDAVAQADVAQYLADTPAAATTWCWRPTCSFMWAHWSRCSPAWPV